MFSSVKHIIFDLGGVLLDVDYLRTTQAFENLGDIQFSQRYAQKKQNSFFDNWEKGVVSDDEFLNQMKANCRPEVSTDAVRDAWNAMLLSFPLRRLQILEQLRYQFDIYLLSNTNIIHESAFHNSLQQDHGYKHIGLFFDRFYFSHRIGKRKPDAETFIQVLDENQLKPEHTLFIDDSPQHIEGANKLGIKTIFLELGMSIEHHVFKKKQPL